MHGPWVMGWGSAMHHDDESSLSAEEVYQKLEKGIYGESLYMGTISIVVETRVGADPPHIYHAEDRGRKQRSAT